MTLVGPHISIAAGIENVPVIAYNLEATTFGMFLGNVKRWESKDIPDIIAQKFQENCKAFGYNLNKIVPHAKYMINLCNPDNEKVIKSRNTMLNELKLAEKLGLSMVNVHPGSNLGKYNDEQSASRIGDSINYILDQHQANVKIVLETTAGQGNDYGYNLAQLANIIHLKVEDKSRVGVCIDTCHSFAAGYPFDNGSEYIDAFFTSFDEIIGLEYLSAIHLNDSKIECGFRKDRHASIGDGCIGADNLKYFANKIPNIPCILETPNADLWIDEINFIKK